MYRARFSAVRWQGVPNLWVECDGIRLESNIGFPFIRDICRALKEASGIDGPIEFYRDQETQPCQSFPSIYAIADGMSDILQNRTGKDKSAGQPVSRSPLSDIMYLALCQIAADPGNWLLLHGHTRRVLLDRGFIDVQEDRPWITDEAREAVTVFEAKSVYPDVETSTEDELHWAGAIIGLQPKRISRRTLLFIERTISGRTVTDLEVRTKRVHVAVPMALGTDEEMRKRRLLAAITNAGKLALAL